MIEWMNSNEGFVMACLTFVTASTAIMTAWLATQSNRISSRSLAQAIEMEDRRTRPFLIFNLEYADRCVFAVLKNIGLSPAVKVRIKTDPQLLRSGPDGLRKEIGMTKFPPTQFLPGQSHRDLIEAGHIFYQEYGGGILTGTLIYSDVSGRQYEEGFVIDLAFMLGLQDIVKPDPSAEIEKIRRCFEKLVKEIEKTGKALADR